LEDQEVDGIIFLR